MSNTATIGTIQNRASPPFNAFEFAATSPTVGNIEGMLVGEFDGAVDGAADGDVVGAADGVSVVDVGDAEG